MDPSIIEPPVPPPSNPSSAEYVNPQAIIVMDKPLLCTSRPGWKGPFAPDVSNCAYCKRKFHVLVKGQFCPCCMRKYCSDCMQHTAVLDSSSSSENNNNALPPSAATPACPACYNHLTRKDARCVARLIPYLTEKNTSIRLDALHELLTLLEDNRNNNNDNRNNNNKGNITNDEFLAGSTVCALRGLFAPNTDGSEARYAAAILAHLLAFGPSSSDAILGEKGYVAAIVDSTDKHGERAPGFGAVVAGLAATAPGRKALLETRRVYKALSKALASGTPEVIPSSVRAVRALASGKEDDPRKNPEAEAEFLVLSSLSAILAGDAATRDPVLRSDALAAADKLCYTRETKMFFCQSYGAQNVLHALTLCAPAAPPAPGDVRHGASILYKFAEIDECAQSVARVAGEIVTLAAADASRDDPETQGGLLQVVSKLARSDATKGPVAELIVDRAKDFAAVFAVLNPVVETAGLRIILAVLAAAPAKARSAFADTDIPATLRRIIVAKSPEAHKAFKALASIDRK